MWYICLICVTSPQGIIAIIPVWINLSSSVYLKIENYFESLINCVSILRVTEKMGCFGTCVFEPGLHTLSK